MNVRPVEPGFSEFSVEILGVPNDANVSNNTATFGINVYNETELLLKSFSTIEGTGENRLYWTARIANPAPEAFDLDFRLVPLTGQANDLEQATGSFHFAQGATESVIQSVIRPDEIVENDELFFMDILNEEILNLHNDIKVNVINDDFPELSIHDVTTVLFDSDPVSVNVPVTLNTPSTSRVIVDYYVFNPMSGPQAIPLLSGQIEISPGEIDSQIPLQITTNSPEILDLWIQSDNAVVVTDSNARIINQKTDVVLKVNTVGLFDFNISFNTIPGFTHFLQRKDANPDAEWENTDVVILGTGLESQTNFRNESESEYFRVLSVQFDETLDD